MNEGMTFASISVAFVDLGGTLIVPEPSVGEQYRREAVSILVDVPSGDVVQKRFLKAFESSGPFSGLHRYGTTRTHGWQFWYGVISSTFPEGTPAQRRELTDRLFDRFRKPECWRVVEPARNFLKHGRERNLRTALVTNWDTRCRRLVDELGLMELFDEIIVSSEVGIEKPDPNIFRLALERMGVHPQEALMIGDSIPNDLDPAEDAGLSTYRIGDPPGEDWKRLLEIFVGTESGQ